MLSLVAAAKCSESISRKKEGKRHWLGDSLVCVEIMVVLGKVPNHPQEVFCLGDGMRASLEPIHLLQRVLDPVVHLVRVHGLSIICDELHMQHCFSTPGEKDTINIKLPACTISCGQGHLHLTTSLK